MAIQTTETHPDHDVIGKRFRFFGNVYLCDSYDTDCGYWMTPADPAQFCPFSAEPRLDERRNVSERAIGRTYHRIYDGC